MSQSKGRNYVKPTDDIIDYVIVICMYIIAIGTVFLFITNIWRLF